jgi:hypothetical protein
MTKSLITVAALVLTMCLGCSRAPTAPTSGVGPGARSGTWLGTFTDTANGPGAFRVELQEAPIGDLGLLGGTWTATFTSGAATATGDVTGSITGATVQVTLRRTVPVTCPNPQAFPALNGAFIALNLTLTGSTLSGPYAYQACGSPVAGTLELRKP